MNGLVRTKAEDKGKAQPFENRTIWNQIFKKPGFQMFPDSKLSDFRSPLKWKTERILKDLRNASNLTIRPNTARRIDQPTLRDFTFGDLRS